MHIKKSILMNLTLTLFSFIVLASFVESINVFFSVKFYDSKAFILDVRDATLAS